jgi:hypothetical protein
LQRGEFIKIRNPCCAVYKNYQQSGDFLLANWIYNLHLFSERGPNFFIHDYLLTRLLRIHNGRSKSTRRRR